ncbi:ATP synthase F1 subunit delta [Candidatus Oscillochloris fontis]|uniref:ATP synthase F1 subunit delta n=1 Tax=Candidatus Oscillochloris fontis TaxID=2496868 RepID=UPI00101BC698|nr:ATP synthase F1 subunit delta [Candidatus Oscillochloris fontis]
MATTVDAKAIAGTLYDALFGAALEQLQAAATKITAPSGDVAQQINAALPADALPQVRNFLLGLAKEGLIDRVVDVAQAFSTLAANPSAQALTAVVTSAVALSVEQQATIVADLRTRYGSDLSATFAVDESLIGGLIIRVGDRVLDNSLRTRLSAIQRNMITS